MGPKLHLSAFGDVTRLDSYVRFAVAALQPQTLVTKSPCDRPIKMARLTKHGRSADATSVYKRSLTLVTALPTCSDLKLAVVRTAPYI
jgi:hypothetical protein